MKNALKTVTSEPAFSLVPANLTQALELAKLIADSDLAPKDYKGKPGNVLIAVQMGQEVGLPPMSAIQNIAVINGKPGLYGDVGKSILLAAGFIIEEDDVEVIKKTGMGRCKITRPGHPPVERTFSRDSAKTAGLIGKQGPWSQYPERMMAWRAFWFAARDAAADVLKGLSGAEELGDATLKDITPMSAGTAAGAILPPYDQEKFEANFPKWKDLIEKKKRTVDEIIATVSSKNALSPEQKKRIEDIAKPAAPETIEHEGAGPTVTFAVLEEKFRKASDLDLLDADADLIAEVEDAEQRSELSQLYKTRRAELVAA
jgi:hypothetical protein